MSTCSERLGHKHKHPNGDGRQMEEESREEKKRAGERGEVLYTVYISHK